MSRRALRASEATTGIGALISRTITGQEVWRVPGPPWDRQLSWAGPCAAVHLHRTRRMDALGKDVGTVSGPCATLAEAQASADAWWLAGREG